MCRKLTRGKMIALLLCACLLLFAALAVTTVLVNFDHDHDGENCGICACLACIQHTVRLLQIPEAFAFLATLFLGMTALLPAGKGLVLPTRTPVALRVRMDS